MNNRFFVTLESGHADEQNYSCEIVSRMIVRYAGIYLGYPVQVVNEKRAGFGVKSQALMIDGDVSKFQFLNGIHRHVFVSPLDTLGRVHTCFTQVSVLTIPVRCDVTIDLIPAGPVPAGGVMNALLHNPSGVYAKWRNGDVRVYAGLTGKGAMRDNTKIAKQLLMATLYGTSPTHQLPIIHYVQSPYKFAESVITGKGTDQIENVLDGDLGSLLGNEIVAVDTENAVI